MKQMNFGNLLSVAVAAIIVGCGHESPDVANTDEPVVFGPQYSVKNGLFVPENTRRSLGLSIVEVTERKLPPTFEVPLRIYQADNLRGRASGMVTAAQAQSLTAGHVIELRSRDDEPVAAQVTRVSDQLQKATGMLELLVEFSQPSTAFLPGTLVKATATLKATNNVVTIPRSALLECTDGHSVYTVNGEHFVRTHVQVGATGADVVEIRDGLYVGDQVVSNPPMTLWMTELAAVKGGQACCVEPAKGK